MKINLFLTLLVYSMNLFALEVPTQSKCVSLPDNVYTRSLPSPYIIWRDTYHTCVNLANVLGIIPMRDVGVSVRFPEACVEISDQNHWDELGCSGTIKQGYFLKALLTFSDATPRKKFIKSENLGKYEFPRPYSRCMEDAKAFENYSTAKVRLYSGCEKGKEQLQYYRWVGFILQ